MRNEIMYNSVNENNECMMILQHEQATNNEQVYDNNISSLEVSRKEKRSGEDNQSKGGIDSRLMTRNAGRNNDPTDKQTNIIPSNSIEIKVTQERGKLERERSMGPARTSHVPSMDPGQTTCGQDEGIPDNCYGHHGRCPCKNIPSGVKFSRLKTKTAYILLFRDIFECFGQFLVNFWV